MSNDIPNFNLLAVFSAVMEHGSLSKAAEHLNTNQSTISTALGRLKRDVGQELFVRNGRGVSPTAYSTSLYAQIKDPIHMLNGVFQSMHQFDETSAERKFVISAPEHLQWALLNHFHHLPYEGISLEVHDHSERDEHMYEDLLKQKFDAVIDVVIPSHSSFANKKLHDGEFVIVCSDTHPRIQGSLSEACFMQEKHALLNRTRNQLYSLSLYTSLDLSQRQAVLYGSSLFANMLLCSQTDYLTVVPLSMASQFKQRLGLQLFKPPFEAAPMTNHLIWLKKNTNDAANQWLRKEIAKISPDSQPE